MRRTYFKRKQGIVPTQTRKLAKRAISASQKVSIGKLQKQLWDECKRIIRNKYKNEDGTWTCFTCGKTITDNQNAHTAHFIPKSVCGAYLKYDLRNLRICCMACNVWLGGNGSMYYKHLVETEGQEYVDKLFRDKELSVKAYDRYALQLIEYKSIV